MSVKVKRNRRKWAWMSCIGLLALSALAWWRFSPLMNPVCVYHDDGGRMSQLVDAMVSSIDSVLRDREAEMREVEYYLHTHQVLDEGYNQVALFAERTQDEMDSLTMVRGWLQGGFVPDAPTAKGYYLIGEMVRRDWIKTFYPAYLLLYKDNVKPQQGYGCYRDSTGVYYEGYWWHGMRDEFGFSVAPHQHLRLGEWKADRYLGERLTYRSDRIYGIDISKYQHGKGRRKYAINWNQLRITHLGSRSKKRISGVVDYPVSFVYIKSTEGTSITNPFFKKDYADAHKNGFRVGSYHFFSIRSTAQAQAVYFLKHTLFRQGDLPPVLDVEPSHSQIAAMGGAQELFRRIRTWMGVVERSTGRRPILYVSQTFVNRYLSQAPDIMEKYQVWIARYGEYKPDVRLAFWQLSADGRVRGIRGEVDINVFNGYQEQFTDFLSRLK